MNVALEHASQWAQHIIDTNSSSKDSPSKGEQPRKAEDDGPSEILADNNDSDLETEITVEPFIIDIALGSEKHRVTLLPGQNTEELAQKFAKDHNLDGRLQKKLVEQLQKNIKVSQTN